MEAGYVSVHAFALLPFCLPASTSYLHILTPPSPSRRRLAKSSDLVNSSPGRLMLPELHPSIHATLAIDPHHLSTEEARHDRVPAPSLISFFTL